MKNELINGRTPEEIKTALKVCPEDMNDCPLCPYTLSFTCRDSVMSDALALIERLESQQTKWISVEERLPEEAGKYIVCTRKKAVYCTAFRFFHGKGYFATDSTTHITHWMPLPEPPEED